MDTLVWLAGILANLWRLYKSNKLSQGLHQSANKIMEIDTNLKMETLGRDSILLIFNAVCRASERKMLSKCLNEWRNESVLAGPFSWLWREGKEITLR